MRKIKVLFVHSDLNLGGAETNRFAVIRNINREKYDIRFCCLIEKGILGPEIEKLGFKIDVLGCSDKSFNIFTTISFLNYLKRNKFDIVHSTLFNTNLHARAAAKIAGVPVVTIEEQSDYERYNPTFRHVFRFASRILANNFTDKIIANSESVLNDLSVLERIRRDKFVVIHNAIDIDKFNIQLTKEEGRNKIGIPMDTEVIGCVASFAQRKGHIYLLDAFAKVLNLFPQTKLLLVGDGPLRAKLQQIVDDKGISKSVIFTGIRKDVPELLLTTDIYVSASLNEAFGVSLIEAMYMQLPCVATNVGGVPEVVKDGETGILVPPRDSHGLAEAIISLLSNRKLSTNMGEAGKKKVLEKFTPDKYLQKLEILWDDLLHQKHQGKVIMQ